jgi:SAM-dependent methyltransferase
MSFEVAAESYGRFMGRFSEPLADSFADVPGLVRGQRALDVGCGPGALTARLIERLGSDAVSGVDPSRPFVEAAQHRFPEVDIRKAVAEDLPFDDDTFDAALAQLVVHFMEDPVAGLREMARVTVPGGVVAACVWDYAGNQSPLSTFWSAVGDVDPEAVNESRLAGAREGHLLELAASAGLDEAEESLLTVTVAYSGFEEWWEPYTLGVGPAGSYLSSAEVEVRDAVHRRCRELLPEGPFDVVAGAWCLRAVVGAVGS